MASRSTTGARGGPGELDFDIKSNLRQVLLDLKEFDPKLATAVRKELRRSGESAIRAMGDILDAESGGVVTGKTYSKQRDSRGRKRKMVDGLTIRQATRTRSKGTRKEIKSGLKLKVATGKARTSVKLSTTKGDIRKAMNTRSFRHPVFGDRNTYVEQPGNRYFNRGAYEQREAVYDALQSAIKVAIDAIDTRNLTLD